MLLLTCYCYIILAFNYFIIYLFINYLLFLIIILIINNLLCYYYYLLLYFQFFNSGI